MQTITPAQVLLVLAALSPFMCLSAGNAAVGTLSASAQDGGLVIIELHDDLVQGPGNEELLIDIFANDEISAADLQLAEFAFLGIPANGYAVFAPGQSLVKYSPNPGYCGLDSFSYVLCDGQGGNAGFCDTAMVIIELICQEPELNDDIFSLPGPVVTKLPVLVNDQNGTGAFDPASIELVQAPQFANIQIDRMSGSIIFKPKKICESDAFYYKACDQNGFCGEARVDVIIGCEEFIVRDDVWSIPSGETAVINVLHNDASYADPECLTVDHQPANGFAEVLGDGMVSYQAVKGWTGNDCFEYSVCAGELRESARVCVVVTPPEIAIPQAFSPNGDGINDALVIRGLEFFPNNQVRIYDRQGRLVFEASSYNNDWVGFRNGVGNRLPADTYYVIVDTDSGQGNREPVVGFTTITR